MRLTLIALTAAGLALAACDRPAGPQTDEQRAKALSPGGAVNSGSSVITYVCLDGQRIEAGYPDGQTAVITYKGHAYTLKIARSGSGARYTGFGLQWWTKGMDQATIAPLKPGEDVATAEGVFCSTSALPPVEPPAPGSPGGLPDDKTPISEAPFTPQSSQGAADVVQTYYALIGERKYGEAWRLWSQGGRASDQTAAGFTAGFGRFESYRAQVGAPGQVEGAAGSSYVEVPVVIYGRRLSGVEVHESGKVTLRRVNDVPGATTEQLKWRIAKIDLKA